MSIIPETPRRFAGFALVVLLAMALGACNLGDQKAPMAADTSSPDTSDLAAAEMAADQAAAEAAERQAALAAAEEAAQARQAELDAAERELADRQAALAAEQRRAREDQARRSEQERLAAERQAAEERERQLAERERELADREAQLAEQAARERDAAAAAAPKPKPAPQYVETTLRPGTVLEIEITKTLTSQNSVIGDTFTSRLAKDIYTADGVLAVPAGSLVRGEVIEVTPLKRIGGQASIGIAFTELVPPIGDPIGLKASFVEVGVDRRGDKKKIIAGAIAGAILGRVVGGKGAGEVLAGAAVGAAAGTAIVGAKADGKDAVIPAGEVVGLVLEEVVTVTTRVTGVVGE